MPINNRAARFNIEEVINGNTPPVGRRTNRRSPVLPIQTLSQPLATNEVSTPDEARGIEPGIRFDEMSTITENDISEMLTSLGSNDTTFTTTSNMIWGMDPVILRGEPEIPRGEGLMGQIVDSNPISYQEFIKKYEKKQEVDKDGFITTIDGKKHLLTECHYLHGEYYHKSHNDIAECYYSKEVELKRKMSCVAETFKIVNDKPVLKNCYIKKFGEKLVHCWSKQYNIEFDIVSLNGIEGWKYKEDLAGPMLIDFDRPDTRIEDVKVYETYKNHFSGCNDKKTLLEIGTISPSHLITEGIEYTFGVELEVARGYIPRWKAANGLNMLCIRDGSVDGGASNGGAEYVTGVLTGDTGVNHLQKICQELSKRTQVNSTCGVHIHIGNIDFTQKFLVNCYRLALFLEKEIFSTLPPSRRKNRYCKQLKKFNFRPAIGDTKNNLIEIEEDYNTLFSYMAVEKINNPTFDYNKDKQHPLGAKCGYNHETPRYCWLNFIPAMFNTRGNGSYSIEVRNHQGSTNFTKIKNWLLFFMSFMAFAEKYPELINPGITMNDILDKMLPKKAKVLSLYFNSRKATFANDENENKEYTESSIEEKKSIKELIQ